MKKDKWLLAKCIAVPLLVGAAAAFLTGGGMQNFDTMKQPPLSPPGFLFPIPIQEAISPYTVFSM